MRKLIVSIIMAIPFGLFAQESANIVYSEIKFLDTNIIDSKKFIPSIENYELGKPLYLTCDLEKSIDDYVKEFNISNAEGISKKIIVSNGSRGSLRYSEILITDFDTINGLNKKKFNEKIFDPSNPDALIFRVLDKYADYLTPGDYTMVIDFVLLDDKGKILQLLASNQLNFKTTEESVKKYITPEFKRKANRKNLAKYAISSFGYDASKKKDVRSKFLEDNRRKYREANKDQSNSLRGKEVKSITINLINGQRIKYMTSTELIITAELANGKKIISQDGNYQGDNTFKEYTIELTGATFQYGKIRTYNTFDEIVQNGHAVTLTLTPVHQPQFKKTYTFNLDYTGTLQYYFQGDKGESGREGASDSGSGYRRGTDGGDGETGGTGNEGPEVIVNGDVVFDKKLNKEFLKVTIEVPEEQYKGTGYVDLKGGKIKIFSNGGDGGNGGRGGWGSDGETCKHAKSGNGGDGGNGGQGGRGGKIIVNLTAKAAKYQSLFLFENEGGSGGSAGYGGNGGNTISGNCNVAGGQDGRRGLDGRPGMNGPKPTFSIK